ncbi:MAG: AAA family ATPase [Candidatus Polarisedimenticolaceae bacterium]|nr:AAA family ATPase [Candidatus Polarisedimenticolaceae bacterium]
MRKILIFGNSGSGKSTLAKKLAEKEGLVHLDLDTLAWLPEMPPQRAPLITSKDKIEDFINSNAAWVVEGCYSDLLEIVALSANEVIFMNLSISQCIENSRNRPWEAHKYENKEAQDNNLEMLVNWIKQYVNRDDLFSYDAHAKLYEDFVGKKCIYTKNEHHA